MDKSRDAYYIAINSYNHCTRKGSFFIHRYIRVGSLAYANKVRDDRPVALPDYNTRNRFESNVVVVVTVFHGPLTSVFTCYMCVRKTRPDTLIISRRSILHIFKLDLRRKNDRK